MYRHFIPTVSVGNGFSVCFRAAGEDRGWKAYTDLRRAVEGWALQSLGARGGVAPMVLSKVVRTTDPDRPYAYLTESITVSAKADGGWAPDSLKRRFREVFGDSPDDGHPGNWGWRDDGEELWLDFDYHTIRAEHTSQREELQTEIDAEVARLDAIERSRI